MRVGASFSKKGGSFVISGSEKSHLAEGSHIGSIILGKSSIFILNSPQKLLESSVLSPMSVARLDVKNDSTRSELELVDVGRSHSIGRDAELELRCRAGARMSS